MSEDFNDRAPDIGEPLLELVDLAGGRCSAHPVPTKRFSRGRPDPKAQVVETNKTKLMTA